LSEAWAVVGTEGDERRQIPAESNSQRLASFVSDLIGAENLIPNPSPDGGGLQQTTTGGFLSVHPHFTVHPYWSSSQRGVIPGTYSHQWAGKVLACGDRYFQRRRGGS